MSEQTSRLAIILDSTGAKRNSDNLATSLERLTAQGEKATGSTDELGFSFKRLATSAAGALSIGIVIKTVDEWGQVAARMKNALKSVEGDIKNYTTIQERFLAISNRNGKDIADTQLLYIGAATAMQELGYSTTQTVDYIESLSSAMTANASSVNEVLSMQNALSAIAATKAQQAVATTEVQRISLKTQLANQTAVLTAATKAETVATTELAAAQGRLSLANNLVKGGLALVGGPVGLAMLAAGGMYAFSASMQQAKDNAVELSRGLDGLIAKLREMTREQKQIKVDELNKSLNSLNSVKFDAYSETSSTRRDLAKAEEVLSKLKEGTDKYAKALEKVNVAKAAVEAADAKYLQARDDESRAINTAKLIQADLNGTLQQGANLLRAHTQTTLPNGAAAFKSFGFDVNTAANALGKFNAASLQLNFTDGGARLKKQLERDIALAKKTGEARERLRAQYAAEDAGETKPENIKVLEDAAAELYNLNQANRELNKTSTYSESAAQKMLSSLKEQQMVLIQQRDTNGSLGSQQQALVNTRQILER
ncbi:TPA: tape measure protein [Providencia rettgeri]